MTAMSATSATGVICDLRTAWTFTDGELPPDRVEVVGNRGSVELTVGAGLDVYAEGHRTHYPAASEDDPLRNEQDHFLACVRDRSRDAGAHSVASFGRIDAGRCGDRISAVLIAHRETRNGDIQPRLRLNAPASAKELKTIGMSVGSLSNPYFIALAEGATNAAKKINPDAKLTVVSSEYDLGKQFSQMDNFIAAGVDLILVAADDPQTH